jgi:serine/threonine protein kinase
MSEHYFAFKPGDTIHEYRVDAVLGQGTFGITYAAEDTNLGEPVAIKEYLPSGYAVRDATRTVRPIGTEEADEIFSWGLESFSREAKSLARMRQRNVVRVRRLFRDHGTAYIVMDLVDGERFDQVLRRYPDGNYPPEELLHLIRGLLRGLRDVHSRGLLHRDLKPSNIIIDREGEPIMIDFGAARDLRVTRAGGVSRIFTAEYAPYEQQTPGLEQKPASDLYALGAILYKAITGALPPHAVSRLSTDRYVRLAGNPAYVGYPPHLMAMIDRLLAVEIQDRPQTADDVLRVLDEATVFVPLRPAAAPPRPAPEPVLEQPNFAFKEDLRPAFKQEPPPLDVARTEVSRAGAKGGQEGARRRAPLVVGIGLAAIAAVGAVVAAAPTFLHTEFLPIKFFRGESQARHEAPSVPPATQEAAVAPATSMAREEAAPSAKASEDRGATRPAGATPTLAAGAPSSSGSSAGASSTAGSSASVASIGDSSTAGSSTVALSSNVSTTGGSSAGAAPTGSSSAAASAGGASAALAIAAEAAPGRASSGESSSPGTSAPFRYAPAPIPPSEKLPARASTGASPSAGKSGVEIGAGGAGSTGLPPSALPAWAQTAVREPEKSPTMPSPLAGPRAARPGPAIGASVFDAPVPARKPQPPTVAPTPAFEVAVVSPPPPPPPPPPVRAVMPPPIAPSAPHSASTDERLAWVRAKYATRPEEVKAFLELYPASEFVGEAQAKLAMLSREALSRFNGTWRSFGKSGCAFTGIMELDQGAFTLTLKEPNSTIWATGEINEDGSIAKVLGSSSNLVPSGRVPNVSVAPVGCRFEFALVDVTTPPRRMP